MNASVTYIREWARQRGPVVPTTEVDRARWDVRCALRRRCNETQIGNAQAEAARQVRNGCLRHDAVDAAVKDAIAKLRATAPAPPRTPPYKPAA